MLKGDPAAIFAALGDPTRLALVTALAAASPQSIASLAAEGAISRQAVTRHLRVLEAAGLVASRRVGRESRFSYRAEGRATAASCLDAIDTVWVDALARLKAHIESA